MMSLDRKAAARDRAAGTVRPPGYKLLTSETRAAAIETVTKKLRKEVAAATGLPEGVDLHLLEFLVLKPQFPTVEFLQLIEKQRKREYDDKFWDWRRREVDPYVEKVVAAVVQKVEKHMEEGGGLQRLFCWVDVGKIPNYPEGWYLLGEKKHVSIQNLVESALAGVGFSVVGDVNDNGPAVYCTVAWGDSLAKQGVSTEPKAKRARGNANSTAAEGGFEALREIRQTREEVAATIVKSVKRLCLARAADGYLDVAVDFGEEIGRVPVQVLGDEMQFRHGVDILDINEMEDIWDMVVESLIGGGYEVGADWDTDHMLDINWLDA